MGVTALAGFASREGLLERVIERGVVDGGLKAGATAVPHILLCR